jgi:anaerobic magnesium-protoporphyrin IX monomethyl ester cyclase
MSKSKIWIKIIAIPLLIIFLNQDIVFAQGGLAEISVPKNLVSSQESYNAPILNTQYSILNTIINIQDAHASLSAQESIVSILDSLVTNYDLSVVAIEGSAGYIDTSLLKTFPDQKARDNMAKGLMAKGLMSAAEFFSITSGKNIALYGIEDRAIYKRNVEEFRRVYEMNESVKKDVDGLLYAMNGLKDKIYSPELKALDDSSASGNSDTAAFKERWQSVKELAAKAGIDYRSYASLSKFVKILELEKGIDFDKANKERGLLIGELSKRSDRKGIEELVLKSVDFKTGKISPGEFYLFLGEISGKWSVPADKYRNLTAYAGYIALYESIDLISIFEEAKAFESAIMGKLFSNDDQKKLYRLLRYTSLIKGLFEIKLTPGDFGYLKEDMGLFGSAEEIESFIRSVSAKYKVNSARYYDLDKVLSCIPDALKFYETAQKRNSAILENTIKSMKQEGRNIAALVTGGFHTKGLTKLLKDKEISYFVILPKFDSSKSERPYVTILTNRKDRHESVLKSGQYYLATAAYFSADLSVPEEARLARYGEDFKEALNAAVAGIEGEATKKAALEELVARWSKNYREFYAATKYKDARSPDSADTFLRSLLGGAKKVMLVQPGFTWQVNKPTRFPVGLMYLASALRKDSPDVDVSIVDMPAEGLDAQGLIKKIGEEKPDIVAVSMVSVFFGIGKEIAKEVKARYPNIAIVAGGPHASAMPVETLRKSDFDIAVIGEGEKTFSEIVNAYGDSQRITGISGIAFKDGAKIVKNAPSLDEYDINELPMAAESLDLLRLDRYDDTLEGELVYPIMATRGCPYGCAFCGGHAVFTRVRKRSPESVVDEIEYVYRQYGIKLFHFLDDTFTVDKSYAKRIFELIMERNLPIKWMAMTRADAIVHTLKDDGDYREEREFLKLAKDSGCMGFAIGVESGDKDLLRLLDKRLDLDILHKATELTKEAGIHVKYFLMVGIPGQDEASVQKTIDVIDRDRPDSVNVTILKPLPGSELFELWLTMKMDAKRIGDSSHIFSQYEILKMWEELRAGAKEKQQLPSRELSVNGDREELMDRLMFEEEPGLKGTFAKDRLSPLFETKEVRADKVIEFRRAIFDAYKKIAKSTRKVPIFRRPFSRKKRDEVLDNVSKLIASEQFEMGHYTLAFEGKIAAKVGRPFAVGVSNGTNALELALRAKFGSLEGKSIIVPANANIADVTAVIHAGANVVLADVSEDTLGLDPAKLESLLDNEGRSLNIVGVILVHMGGVISGDIERIIGIAKKRDLFLLEDASDAMGSSRKGLSAGRFGDAAVFSLFSTKVLTSFNGAVIVTDDKNLSAKMRSYRDMGRVAESREGLYDASGGNYKMDEMQAIVAAADLEDLDSRISRRREIARTYDANFQGMEGLKIVKVPGSESNYYKYILTVDPAVYPDFNYNKLKIEAARAGIDLPGRIYSYTLDKQIYPEGRLYIPQSGVPIAEQLTCYQIALPIYEDLTDGEAGVVIDEVNRYISELYGRALKERTGSVSEEKAKELPVAREGYYHKYAKNILMKHLQNQQQKGRSLRFAMKPGDGVSVKAGVRIPFSSCIASDRLPVSISEGGNVLNMAALINGEKPIGVNVNVLKDNTIRLVRTDYDSSGMRNERATEIGSVSEIGDYSNVDDAFRLAKIFLLASGIVDPQDARPLSKVMASLGGGLQIETYHNVSQGGGSSNILSIAAFTALDKVIGTEESIEDINKSALLAELLTGSIGGWQDHLGVYYPGIKELVTLPGEIMPRAEPLKLNETALKKLKDNLILWDSVVSRDSARASFKPVLSTQTTSSSLMNTLRKRSRAVHQRMIDALAAGDTALFGRMLTEKYNLAKLTSPGVRTDYLDEVMKEMKGLIDGASSMGTGGGGYCLLVAKDGCRDKIEELLKKRGRIRKWSIDEKGLEVKVHSSALESLQDKKFIDEWDEVFDGFKKEALSSPALYETVSLIFEGSGDDSLDFSVVIPKDLDDDSSERVLRYISAQIHNRVVTRGATRVFVRSGIEGITERLSEHFTEHYNNSRAIGRIGDMAGAYFGVDSFTIKDFSGYSPQLALDAAMPPKSEGTAVKAAPVKIIGINFGKMMTKAGIAEIDGKGMFRHLCEPVSFRTWPEGADRSDLKPLIARAVKAVREKVSESGLDISVFDGIGVSVSVVVRGNSIVKFRTGISADFSQDALEQLGEIKRLISSEFPGKEITLENDGNLEALGVARSLGLRNTLTLKFGNTLSAGLTDENGRISEGINEFTKSVIDMSADAYMHNLTKVIGWAGSYISWFGIENNARILGLYEKYDFDSEKEVPRVLRRWLSDGSDEQKKDARQVFERVGRCIAALVRSLEPLYKIDHVVLSGGILAGESGKIITGSANTELSRGKEAASERVRLVDENEMELRYGYLKGLAYLAQGWKKAGFGTSGEKGYPALREPELPVWIPGTPGMLWQEALDRQGYYYDEAGGFIASKKSCVKERDLSYDGITIYDNSHVRVKRGSPGKVQDLADLLRVALLDASRIIPRRGPPIPVHVIPYKPHLIGKTIVCGEAHLTIDQNYVETFLTHRNRHPNAIRWLTAEKLAHELNHGNTMGTDEEEAVEERDNLIDVDMVLYRYLCAHPELKAEVDRFFDETGYKSRAKKFFQDFLAVHKDDPPDELQEAAERFIDSFYAFSFKFYPAEEKIDVRGDFEPAGVEKSYPAKKENLPKMIFFDIDGVLLKLSADRYVKTAELLKNYGVNISSKELVGVLYGDKDWVGSVLRGEITAGELIAEINKRLKKFGLREDLTYERLFELRYGMRKSNAKMARMLSRLKRDGVNLGLLSGRWIGDPAFIQKKLNESYPGIFDDNDLNIFTCNERLGKDDAALFTRAMERASRKLGISNDEILFIDDSEEVLKTAAQAGLRGLNYVYRDGDAPDPESFDILARLLADKAMPPVKSQATITAGKSYIVGVPRGSVPPLERPAIAREIDRIFNGSAEIYVMESSNPAELMAEASRRGIKYGAILDIGSGSNIQEAIAHLQALADKAFREAHADIAIINASNMDSIALSDLAAKVAAIERLLPAAAPASIEALKADLQRRTRVIGASFAHVDSAALNALLENKDRAVSVTTQGVVESGMLYSLRDKIRARWQNMDIHDKRDDPIKEVVAITDPRIKNDDAAKRYISALGLEGYVDYAFARTAEEVNGLSTLYDGTAGRVGLRVKKGEIKDYESLRYLVPLLVILELGDINGVFVDTNSYEALFELFAIEELPNIPGVSKDEAKRIFIYIPKAVPMDYDKEVREHQRALRAILSAA